MTPRSKKSVLVVDQGSTNTKAAVFDSRGTRIGQASARVETHRDGDRVEHDPAAIIDGVRSVIDRLLRRHGRGSIAAIGVTCQRSTCLLWHRADGEPLTRALSWQDRRRAAAARRLGRHARKVARRTGLRLSPHYAALKLAHLLDETPGARRLAGKGAVVAGTLDAFLLQQLTGHASTEPGHAGRTLLYNLGRNAWDPSLGELFRVPPAALPALAPSAGRRGTYQSIPVTALAGDQQAALLGHGGWRRGVTATHLGTGAFVLASTGSKPKRHPRLLAAALATTPRARRFQLEGSVNSAGSAIDWAARWAGVSLGSWSRRRLDPETAPLVLPAFAGAGAPWWQPGAQSTILGLDLGDAPDRLLEGVLCGVAMRVLDCLETLAAAGEPTRVLRVSGKATRLSGLMQLLADAGQVRTEVSAEEETGLTGMARLTRAGLDRVSAPLDLGHEPSAVYTPAWDQADAHRVRRRWRAFARRAVQL